jgi:hypothetical protein
MNSFPFYNESDLDEMKTRVRSAYVERLAAFNDMGLKANSRVTMGTKPVIIDAFTGAYEYVLYQCERKSSTDVFVASHIFWRIADVMQMHILHDKYTRLRKAVRKHQGNFVMTGWGIEEDAGWDEALVQALHFAAAVYEPEGDGAMPLVERIQAASDKEVTVFRHILAEKGFGAGLKKTGMMHSVVLKGDVFKILALEKQALAHLQAGLIDTAQSKPGEAKYMHSKKDIAAE